MLAGDVPLFARIALDAEELLHRPVAVPLARNGFITAIVLGFAHTVGEFGVVLMIGGNIPGSTHVASISIYDHVERLDYTSAHWLSGILLFSSFVMLALVYAVNRKFRLGGSP